MNNRQTKFGKMYTKYIDRLIPAYAVISLIMCFVINSTIYTGTQLLLHNVKRYDFTSSLDNKVPFVKEWMLIYVICFAFWGINYILITREGKEQWFRFAAADMISRVICGIFFIFLPTTNVRPVVTGTDFFSQLTQFIYNVDAPTNLFPSIHCLVSWFCFIGIRKSHKIPMWYKVFSCIFALLVCASTQFTKQHYLVDVAGGILLAELCYALTSRTNIYTGFEHIFSKITSFIMGNTDSKEV